MLVLGIETSCDETAAAVVCDTQQILAHNIFSQINQHQPFGGVVPELASRAHMDILDKVINKTMVEAQLSLNQIDAVAVTAGPGLIGGVIVGVMMAKAIASVTNKPFLAINHLEGHALTARLGNKIDFPFLLMLMSGGHCQILLVKNVGQYQMLGSTFDDALGEAFDKVAKMLGLPYPGGPEVEKLAKLGDARKFNLPKAFKGRAGCDFSFSGLKTAVRKIIAENELSFEFKADLCSSFQYTVTLILIDRLQNAVKMVEAQGIKPSNIVLAGGVAANLYIKSNLDAAAKALSYNLICPPVNLCTDNGVMIAWAGIERLRLNMIDQLNFAPRARWPLEEL